MSHSRADQSPLTDIGQDLKKKVESGDIGSGSVRIIKSMLHIFNVTSAIVGLVFIISGSSLLFDIDSHGIHAVVQSSPRGAALTLTIIGGVTVAVSLLGSYAAVQENHRMLQTYSLIVLFLLVVELCVVGTIYSYRSDTKSLAVKGLKKALLELGSKERSAPVEMLQKHLHCCGAESPKDWTHTSYYEHNHHLPQSCCEPSIKAEDCQLNNTIHVYQQPCWEAIEHEIQGRSKTLGKAAVFVALIQVLAIFLAYVLAKAVRGGEDSHNWLWYKTKSM